MSDKESETLVEEKGGKRKKPACDSGEKPKKRKKKGDPTQPYDSEKMRNVLSETVVFYANGLRYVRPYMFTFSTYAKLRWYGKTLLDVFTSEFRMETGERYRKAILAGRVRVNSKICSPDTVIKNSDLLTSCMHRHEPPVTGQPVKVIHSDDDIVVVDKPSSIPVHPTGRYRHNSLTYILQREHGIPNAHCVHRLDRLTSGVILFARTPASAERVSRQIREHSVEKTYLARVVGEFPSERITVDQPILVKAHKLGICLVSPSGKPSTTVFERQSFNGRTSVVKCLYLNQSLHFPFPPGWPRTGRMHQIRVHLRFLGFPIANDPIYNHPGWNDPSVVAQARTPLEIVLHSILVEQQGVEEGTHQLGLIVNGMRQQEASTSTEGGGDAEEKEKVDLMALPCFRTLNALCTSTPEESKEDSSDAVPSSEQSDSPEKSTGQTSAVLESPNTRTSLASNPDTPGTSAACSAPGSSRGSSKYIDAAVLPDLSEAPDFPLPIPGEDTVDDFPFGLGVASTNAPHESDVERPVFTENPWDPVERMPFCSFCCGVSVPDPKPEQLVLFLHALSYKGDGWEYKTEEPAWAKDDWNG